MNGEIKEEFKERANTTILPIMLKACDDFANKISALEDLRNHLSTRTWTVTVKFSPKYHCELAGCGIELGWGFSKRHYRRKMNMKEKKADFKGCVERCLRVITKDHCRRFLNRVRRYAEAYRHFDGKETSFKEIERFVKLSKAHRSALVQEFGYLTAEVDALGWNE